MYLEGDVYDDEKEILNGDKAEPMVAASNDAEIIVHNVIPQQIGVNAEAVKVKPYKAIFDKLLFKNSPVIMESNRWKGMLNIVYNYTGHEAIVYQSIYVGDG